MPPAFIVGLAVAIVLGLLFIARDFATRGKRRARFAAEAAAQRALENQPVPGLDQTAIQGSWQGPLADPVLIPGLPNAGQLPAGLLRAGHPLDGMTAPPAKPVSPARLAGNLTLHLHSVLNPRSRFRHIAADSGGQPDYYPYGEARLVHCYRGQASGSQFLVGNCWCTLPDTAGEGAHMGPLPEGASIGSAFCAVGLPRAILGHVQVVPLEKSVIRGGGKTGYPDLDARYRTFAPFGSGSRSRIVRAAQAALLPQDVDPIGPQFAAFIASRSDWAFTVDSGLLVCATYQPLRTGEQARQLVADTATAVGLIGK